MMRRLWMVVVVVLVSLAMPVGLPVAAQASCEIEAYKARVPASEPYGPALIELKREPFDTEAKALDALKGYMEDMYYGPFDQVGVDHSDDQEAIELDAYEIGAILPGRNPMTVGSISGYYKDGMLYTFYLENQSNGGPPSSTSDFVWEIIELVQKSETHTLEEVLADNVFGSSWSETRESALSCR